LPETKLAKTLASIAKNYHTKETNKQIFFDYVLVTRLILK